MIRVRFPQKGQRKFVDLFLGARARELLAFGSALLVIIHSFICVAVELSLTAIFASPLEVFMLSVAEQRQIKTPFGVSRCSVFSEIDFQSQSIATT